MRKQELAPTAERNGFTLMEMLVVIFIVGILATISMPYLIPTHRFATLDGAADNLISTFSATRSTAIAENTYCRIKIEAATGTLEMQQWDPLAREWRETGVGYKLPERVSFKGGGITFPNSIALFDPHGALNEGGGLIIEDAKGESVELTSLIASGRLMRKG